MSAAEDLYGSTERRIARAFSMLEQDGLKAAPFDPGVDGGQRTEPMAKTAEGAWIEAEMKRLPQEQRDALRAHYQGRGILDSMREKKVKWKKRNGVHERTVETQKEFSQRRLRDLTQWEQGQLWERRAACHRLSPILSSTLPSNAVLHIVLEWSGHYSDYATEQITRIAKCHPSTVSRNRKNVYSELDRLRKHGVWGIAQRGNKEVA